MKNGHAGRTISVWMETQPVPAFDSLKGDAQTDVCVVGAGIAGLTTAYMLVREGRGVIVLDDGPVLSGESERTTAHLASALDDRFFKLERIHGIEGARLAAQSHSAAIDRIESIIKEESIECDFTRLDGYLFVPPGESTEILEREYAAARNAGLDVELVERAPLRICDTGRALRFANQGQFHPVKYLAALARAFVNAGGRIFTHTHASKIQDGDSPVIETLSGHVVKAKAVVVATNTPVNDRVVMHTKQAPYRTYVIAARIPKDSVPLALYWDTADPYHYIRLQDGLSGTGDAGSQVVIVGGEDHKTGQDDHPEEHFKRLEAWADECFQVESILNRWSGQVMEPVDSLAFIGANPGQKNIFIATGDSGHGMTHGTIAGILLTDLIAGRENPWANLYEPSRKPMHSLGEFARENINVAKQYLDLVTLGDTPNDAVFAAQSGAVIRRGGKKIAVYCDAAGERHECSAICPHLGCLLAWNSVEQTWDCPCHGSRFDPYGEVLNGPANINLETLQQAPR